MFANSASAAAMLIRSPIAHCSSGVMPSVNQGRPATVLANSVSSDAM